MVGVTAQQSILTPPWHQSLPLIFRGGPCSSSFDFLFDSVRFRHISFVYNRDWFKFENCNFLSVHFCFIFWGAKNHCLIFALSGFLLFFLSIDLKNSNFFLEF